MSDQNPCLCGSNLHTDQCCQPYISGIENAPTAEALMRSRYVAYATNNNDYILQTWHSSTRPEKTDILDDNTQWTGLEILNTEAGLENDAKGIVEFRARCRIKGQAAGLDESSEFIREDGRWYYVDGSSIQPIRTRENKVGRNEPCPCGSGKKYKRCCGE